MINTLCNGLNPSQASLQLSLCVDTWDEFGPFTVHALDRAGRKKGTELLLQLGRGMAKRMERMDGSGRDPEQPLPSAPSRSTGGLWVGADVCGACVPALPSPWTAATPWHLSAKALGLGHALACHVELPSPDPENAGLPDLAGCGNGKDGERCLPYLRGQIASSCGQIKSDGDRLEEGVCSPCKANSFSLFPARSGSSQAAFWAGKSSLPQG